MRNLNYNIVQILASALALFFITLSAKRHFSGESRQTTVRFLLILFVWLGILVFSLFPNVPLKFSITLGIGNNLNTLIFLGFVVIFLVLLKIINMIDRIESEITQIVRNEALKRIKKSQKKSSNYL